MKKKLTYAQFLVLSHLDDYPLPGERTTGDLVKYLESQYQMDANVLIDAVTFLNNFSMIRDCHVTRKGYRYLEPYRVKRAILLAAGFGSRLHPVTVNTPKPLVRVCGERIIDTLIKSILRAGIKEIYIVRGYLADSFDALKAKYPEVKFIDNPEYSTTNNISSVFYARNLLSNTYVFESDIYLRNRRLITKYQYSSNYLGIYRDKTDDWCFTMEKGFISSQVVGGKKCYQEIGLSYWTEEDGKRLSKYLYEAYLHYAEGKQIFWDQVPFKYHIDEFKVRVRPCDENDVIEIDTLDDLKSLDKAYIAPEYVEVK